VILTLCCWAPLHAQQSATTTLQVPVTPQCSLSILNSSVTGVDGEGVTGTITFTYTLRTGRLAGSGAIELALAGDSSLEGAALTYASALPAAGVSRSGTEVLSSARRTQVAVFGANAHSSREGNTGSVNWTLKNYRGAAPTVRLAINCS
jgi:hypothetical protein